VDEWLVDWDILILFQFPCFYLFLSFFLWRLIWFFFMWQIKAACFHASLGWGCHLFFSPANPFEIFSLDTNFGLGSCAVSLLIPWFFWNQYIAKIGI
jgi:hypothetical protein